MCPRRMNDIEIAKDCKQMFLPSDELENHLIQNNIGFSLAKQPQII